ncbi:MAG TPA: lytic transglycosylase domain-containing protein [Syntrophomonadaceae bacterium]|nr:lytic transglycosylase domain-containing protein [Syntrophomonadaceae bacterium]
MSDSLSEFFNRLSLVRLIDSLSAVSARRNKVSTAGQVVQNHSPINRNGDFSELIKKASEKYHVDERVISAVINQESSFDAQAVSSCGAQGLMQLMPGTATSLGVTDPFNPEQNIMAGTQYLREKLDEFGGNLSSALAAYNAGSGAVRKYGGVPPYKETQAYVAKIMRSIDYIA